MKAHIGVDAESGLVHSLVSTAANVNDVTQAGALLHAHGTDAFGDAGYQGVAKREEAQGQHWHVAMKPGKRKLLTDSTLGQMLEKVEKIKASTRAKVEHPFHVVKNLDQQFPRGAGEIGLVGVAAAVCNATLRSAGASKAPR